MILALAWWAAISSVLAVATCLVTDPVIGLRRMRR